MKRSNFSHSFASYAYESFKSFFKDIRFAFFNPDEDSFSYDIPHPPPASSSSSSSTRKRHHSSSFQRKQQQQHAQNQHDYGKFETILQSAYLNHPHRQSFFLWLHSYVNLTYHCDIQGPVPLAVDRQPFNSLTAPQWGLDIFTLWIKVMTVFWPIANVVCNAATIVYGPWANRQKDSLHSFFFPPDYEAMKVHIPVANQPRQYASFNLNITFNHETTFRIPFREISKDQQLLVENADPKPAWLEIKMSNISTLHYVAPMVATRDSGYTVTIDAVLAGCTISTSLTNTPFLYCSSLGVCFGPLLYYLYAMLNFY